MANLKQQLFEQLALVAHSLGSPQRIELLDYLAQAERTVDELSQLSQLSIANTSRHLQILKNNGLVKVRRRGKNRLYRLADQDVVLLVQQLRAVSENHLAEAERLKTKLAQAHDDTPVIHTEEIITHINDDNYVFVDVRPTNEYAQGHIKGATNITPEMIDSALESLPHDKIIVAYCRGPYCTYSHQLIQALRKEGVEAFRIEEGFPEWKAAGLPYTTTH